MKVASIAELKKEIKHLTAEELSELLLQVVKYKKENKELLSYLLFDSEYEPAYIEKVKEEMEKEFQEMNRSNVRFVKKALQRILKFTRKQIKFSNEKTTEIELLYYYCELVMRLPKRYFDQAYFENLIVRQSVAITKAIDKLVPDLQADYREEQATLAAFVSKL